MISETSQKHRGEQFKYKIHYISCNLLAKARIKYIYYSFFFLMRFLSDMAWLTPTITCAHSVIGKFTLF